MTVPCLDIQAPEGVTIRREDSPDKAEVHVHVPRKLILKEPIRISYRRPRAHTVLVAEEGSEVQLIESYPEKSDARTVALTEIQAGPGSGVDHFRIQEESESAVHEGTVRVHQSRASRYRSYVYNLGGRSSRSEVLVSLDDEGAFCELMGLFAGRQDVDNQTTIDHLTPHGTSRELYKGILAGSGQGIFNGKIIVRPDAQKTEARQMNKNLLLSREAGIDTRPILEIFADDVKCQHGATIGRLDPAALFYLRSRGIGDGDAHAMLTRAFAADMMDCIPWAGLRAEIEKRLAFRLGGIWQ